MNEPNDAHYCICQQTERRSVVLEEFSFTAFLAVFLFLRFSLCVCVCVCFAFVPSYQGICISVNHPKEGC